MAIPKVLPAVTVAVVLAFCGAVFGADETAAKSKPKPNAARLKGMKAAIVDIEKGALKEKHPPYPDAPQHKAYFDALKKLGVTIEVVNAKTQAEKDEMGGYNDVIRVEIEHRHGRGIVEKLWKEAWGDEAPAKGRGANESDRR